MRGLPPVPSNVAQLVQSWDVDDRTLTTGWWIFDPAQSLSNDTAMRDFLADYFSRCLPSLLELVHNNCSATACRLLENGLSVTEVAPPNHGPWSGGTPHHTATGLSWKIPARGRRGWSLTYVPGTPDIFTSHGVNLSATGWGNAQASALDFMNAINATTIAPGAPLVLGTVQRARGGVPLPAAVFAPYETVNPCTKLVTIRRRMPSARAVSPSV